MKLSGRDYFMNFGEYIEQVRKEQGLTQEEFLTELNQYVPADERYKSKQSVSYWELNQQRPPRITWLGWIANRAPVDSWARSFAVKGIDILESQRSAAQMVSDNPQPAGDITIKDDGYHQSIAE
jgi:transcriptional regulator with XRE-family HTH domain